VDIQAKLDEITEMVETARAMPMSASCMINRTEVLTILDEIRELLPAELREAQWVIKDRDAVVDEGRRRAERIVADAITERDRLVGETEVLREAARQADRIVGRRGVRRPGRCSARWTTTSTASWPTSRSCSPRC
jgi:cell division septum initiation protein DivIVA